MSAFRVLSVSMVVALVGCKVTSPSDNGPSPRPQAVSWNDGGNLVPAVLCTDRGGVLQVTGAGFAPRQVGGLTENSTLELPTVILTDSAGADVTLTDVTYAREDESLGATVPVDLAVDVYDLTVINPSGERGTLADAVEIESCARLTLCSEVNPGFGWAGTRTTIEICAEGPAEELLQSTPEVFLLVGGVEIPLVREAYLEPTRMTAVVPAQSEDARLVVGGPYDVVVINPNHARGVVPAAFTILTDPPPQILAVTPALGDAGSAVTVTVVGADFKNGTLDGATPELSIALIDVDGNEFACGAATVQVDVPTAGQDTATCDMTLPGATGGYVLRVRHDDDSSFDLFALFAVTQPSRKLDQDTSPMPTLVTARRAHGVALGTDDLGNRFLYAVGGENGTSGALASVEMSSVGRFGGLGPWSELATSLPEGRTGVALAQVGQYLYAIGGSADGSVPVAANTVLRARILGADTAPVLAEPVAATGGSLAAGTYYYRVAAVMTSSTDNALGESLPSDEVSIRANEDGLVTLSWSVAVPADVDHYRVYRSPEPNLASGSEVLLADNVQATTYEDDGDPAPASTDVPRTTGGVGEWMVVAELAQARFDAAATAVRIDDTHAYLYVAGGRSGPGDGDVLRSSEWAELTANGGALVGDWQAGPDMPLARAEHSLRPVTTSLAPNLPAGTFAIAATNGTDRARATAGVNGGLQTIDMAVLDDATGNLGEPLAWASGGSVGATRVGATAIVVNDYFYAFNGWGGSGGSFPSASEKSGAAPTCSGGPPCVPTFSGFSSATMTFPAEIRYRSGLAFFGAYFYFVGGSSAVADPATASITVVRGSY